MAKIAKVQEVAVSLLKPYEHNAKIHGAEQIQKLKDSILEFGFLTPCLIDQEYNLIAGHGRVEAAKSLGMDKIPCVFIEGLTEAQKRAYVLADNRLGELGEWNMDIVDEELADLFESGFFVDVTGFDMPKDWFKEHERFDMSRQDNNDEYNQFLDKFEPKKTTDDCYTPDNIYDAIAGWVEREYGVNRKDFVRPFYPGGDYQSERYKETDIVVDNPPFSILSEIVGFYADEGVRFFLFAPSLTLFSSSSSSYACSVCCGVGITYENGAVVSTSFLTNLEDARFRTAPELYRLIKDENEKNVSAMTREIPNYEYPPEVVTSSMLSYLSKWGEEFRVSKEESAYTRCLDSQKEKGKAIFGSGYLISEKAAAEKAAAEKWELSDREHEIIRGLK